VGGGGGLFDLSVCSDDADYAGLHMWNVVVLDGDECVLVDCVSLPSDVRPVDNSAALLEQIGAAERDVP
jgi:glyoxylase-like metal-dependent hydrolase (beta-lactamase superfamily II)